MFIKCKECFYSPGAQIAEWKLPKTSCVSLYSLRSEAAAETVTCIRCLVNRFMLSMRCLHPAPIKKRLISFVRESEWKTGKKKRTLPFRDYDLHKHICLISLLTDGKTLDFPRAESADEWFGHSSPERLLDSKSNLMCVAHVTSHGMTQAQSAGEEDAIYVNGITNKTTDQLVLRRDHPEVLILQVSLTWTPSLRIFS